MGYIAHPYPQVYWAQVVIGLFAFAGVGALAWLCVMDMWRTAKKETTNPTDGAGEHTQSGQ